MAKFTAEEEHVKIKKRKKGKKLQVCNISTPA